MQRNALKIVVLVGVNGLNFLVNFITLPFLTRSLSYEDFGSYAQVLLVAGILQVLFAFGLAQVTNVVFAERKSNEGTVFSTLFWLSFIGASTSSVVLFLCNSAVGKLFSNEQLPNLLIIYIPALFFSLLSSSFTSVIAYVGRITLLSWVTVLTNTLRVLAIFAAVRYFSSLWLMLLFLGGCALVQFLCYLLIIPSSIRRLTLFDFSCARDLFQLGFPMLLTGLAGVGILYLDGFLVSTFLTVKDFAIYRSGAIEIPFISSMYIYVSTVMLPQYANLALGDHKEEIFQIKRKSSSITAIVIFPVVLYFVFLSEIFIRLYLSDRYIDSALIFAIYNLATLVRINDYQDVLIVYKRNRDILKANIWAVVFNVCLNLILIVTIGAVGAAIAYTLSVYFIAALLIAWTCRATQTRVADYFDWNLLLRIVLIICVPLTAILIISRVFHSMLMVAIGSLIYFGLYSAYLVFSQNENVAYFRGYVWQAASSFRLVRS